MFGTINAINDVDGGPGAGIYINGNIKHKNNPPIINLTNTSKITSTGNGIYSAGYAKYNIKGSYISGEESALGIKSGIFNVKNATLIGTGPDKTPTSGNNNGINPSGTAIQIESNNEYKGDIELYIENGTIQSKHSNVIYEYTVNNTNTKVKNITLSGGTYKSFANKPVFQLSNSFKTTHPNFITGGTYSSNPSDYLKNGYTTTETNNEYKVIEVFNEKSFKEEKKEEKNNFPLITIIISSILIISFIIYKSRYKKLNLFK